MGWSFQKVPIRSLQRREAMLLRETPQFQASRQSLKRFVKWQQTLWVGCQVAWIVN
jgi:hypothetical protein